jgi:hypothetical protein
LVYALDDMRLVGELVKADGMFRQNKTDAYEDALRCARKSGGAEMVADVICLARDLKLLKGGQARGEVMSVVDEMDDWNANEVQRFVSRALEWELVTAKQADKMKREAE